MTVDPILPAFAATAVLMTGIDAATAAVRTDVKTAA
jgi:hypothetical protein